MRQVLKLAAVSAAATLVLAACGDAPEEETSGGSSPDEAGASSAAPAAGSTDFKACMVSDAGGFDDQSFNQSGAEGMESAKSELGIETTLVESTSDADYAPNVTTLISQGCDLTIGVGFLLAEAVGTAAGENADANFALIDAGFGAPGEPPPENGKAILFNTAEASFLAGYLAAGMSESGTVATFGGIQIPSVAIFMDGYADGVAKFNEDNADAEPVKVLGWDKDGQTGSFSGDFDNQAAGQTLTDQFIAQGADIIMPVAGPVGLGAIAAAEGTEGTKVIWVDSDGFNTTEGGAVILTSVLKQIGPAVDATIAETVSDGFSNEPYVGTLENDGVGLAPYHDFEADVPADLTTKIDEYKQQIIDGTLAIESPNSP